MCTRPAYDKGRYLAGEIAKLGPFEIMCDGDPADRASLRSPGGSRGWSPGYTLYDLADRLRTARLAGAGVPAHRSLSDIAVQRILVRLDLNRDLAAVLIDDMRAAIVPGLRSPPGAEVDDAAGGVGLQPPRALCSRTERQNGVQACAASVQSRWVARAICSRSCRSSRPHVSAATTCASCARPRSARWSRPSASPSSWPASHPRPRSHRSAAARGGAAPHRVGARQS